MRFTSLFVVLSLFIGVLTLSVSLESVSSDLVGPQFNVSGSRIQNEKIKCKFLCCSKKKKVVDLCKIIKYDLEFSDQLKIGLQGYSGEIGPKLWDHFLVKDYSLTLVVRDIDDSEGVEVVLKDNATGDDLYSQKYNHVLSSTLNVSSEKTSSIVMHGHKISSNLFFTMTGETGPFLNKIAYCVLVSNKKKSIFVSDYTCSDRKNVVPFNTINVAPAFNNNWLYYSQFTKKNNRLMSVNLNTGKHKIVCSYEGHNMQPSFSSKDPSKVVLCMSASGSSELYLYDRKLCKRLGRRVFKKLTDNGSNNVSPTLLPSGNVLFCSDFETGLPQIYYLSVKLKKTTRLTNGTGYCAAPSYCEKNKTVVYTRVVRGVFQLFSLNLSDMGNVVEKQMTFDLADKHEPSWHESGKYLAFSYSKKRDSKFKFPQIAIQNVLSGKIRVLTSGAPKSYPVWKKSGSAIY